jgi:diphthamide biosynthesis protein 7
MVTEGLYHDSGATPDTITLSESAERESQSDRVTTVIKKKHEAGVTAILPLPMQGIVLTGSYDEHVRVLDLNTRRVITERRISGGGVWRLEALDSSTYQRSMNDVAKRQSFSDRGENIDTEMGVKVLVSCMHAGTRVLEVSYSKGEFVINVVAAFCQMSSMNYASAVAPRDETSDTYDIVSTSFYDRKVCLWRYSAKPTLVT